MLIKLLRDEPALLVLDAQGVEKLMNGDLEGDAAVLLEPDLVSAATRAVRDDCVAAAVSRDDVQVVRLPVALNKPVIMNETVLKREISKT